MKVLFKWTKASSFHDKNAYYIEVSLKDVNENILLKLCLQDRERLNEDYIEDVNKWAENNPRLAKKNHVYLLASEDGSACQLMEPYFPYSSQWNAYNPLLRVDVSIFDLSELPSLAV